MLREWRERRSFNRQMTGVVERVSGAVDQIEAEVNEAVRLARRDLAAVPGALVATRDTSGACPRCGGSVRLVRTQWRKNRWRSDWTCDSCGSRFTPDEVKASY